MQRAHAIANGVFVAAVNRVGHEGPTDGGIEFWGHSFVADPFGVVLAEAGRRRRNAGRRVRSERARSRCGATGRSSATAASTPTATITQRFLDPSSNDESAACRAAAEPRATPARRRTSLGYRMPAEWEPHAATWLAWPHEPTDWPGKFDADPVGLRARSSRHLHARRARARDRRRASACKRRRAERARAVAASTCEQVDFVAACRPTARGRAISCRCSWSSGPRQASARPRS